MRGTRLMQLVSVVTVTAIGAAFAAPAGAKTDRGNVDGKLVIASLAPETGDLSAIVDSLRIPVKIAVDEMNAAGGVNGQDVGYVTGDDGTDPQIASTTLDRLLTSDKVDAVIGPASSTTAKGLLDKIKTSSVVMCSGSTTDPALSTKGIAGGYFFRTAPPDKLQAPALSGLIINDGFSKVAIIALNDAYGQGFAKALSKSLKSGGAKVTANVAYDPKGTSYDSDAQKVAASKPKAVAVIAFPDTGAKVLQALIAAGVGPKDVQIYTTDGLETSSLPASVDPANPAVLDGVKGTTPAAAPAGIKSPFTAKFKATGVDAVFSSYYYDCTILAGLAAVKAKSDDPAKIKTAFTQNLKGKTSCKTFKACATLLKAGKTIHYKGASSNFTKFSDHEPLSGVYDVYNFDAQGKKGGYAPADQVTIG